MFSNIRNPILLFILSCLAIMMGLLLEIMHWPGARLIIGSMVMVQAIAIAWLIILLVKRK